MEKNPEQLNKFLSEIDEVGKKCPVSERHSLDSVTGSVALPLDSASGHRQELLLRPKPLYKIKVRLLAVV